jgi:hypothetical protein
MIAIKFPDQQSFKKALGFLVGRFSGRALRTGEIIVPADVLEALALENFSFTVIGRATHEQMAPIRNNGTTPVQRRRKGA